MSSLPNFTRPHYQPTSALILLAPLLMAFGGMGDLGRAIEVIIAITLVLGALDAAMWVILLVQFVRANRPEQAGQPHIGTAIMACLNIGLSLMWLTIVSASWPALLYVALTGLPMLLHGALAIATLVRLKRVRSETSPVSGSL